MYKRFVALLILPFLFASCSKNSDQKVEKPSILVSIAPYAFFAEKIAGDTLNIQTLIPPGTNLHIYEPSPRSVENNAHAVAWFRIDEPVEAPVVKALKERAPQMKMVNLQDGLPLMTGDGAIELTPCSDHDHDHHHHHHHHDRDLHTWLSPKLALKQAQMITDTLVELFPENAELYKKNFNDLMLKMVQLESDISQKLAPFKGNAILVSHPAFGYFCRDYELIQLSVECEGKEPRPKDVENIVKRAQTYKVRCVFLQQGFNNRGAQLIGKKLQLPYYHVDPYARDYFSNMSKISGNIAK